jgi:hypothetical protein|uniref:Uncharacterized protein n=1 Tax=viral metagenome TaxID=1070528 RepID=A0A6C0F156_9ZZZZ
MQRKHEVAIDIQSYDDNDMNKETEKNDNKNVPNYSRFICAVSALTLLAIATVQIYCIDASIK